MKRWYPVLTVIGILVLGLLITLILKKYSHDGIELKEKPKVALIQISGLITIDASQGFLKSGSSTNQVLEDLERVKKDKSIKGVIFEINSPGGMVVASQEVADKIKELQVPKIALIREIGTSGAYWIATATDTIVASPVSITGSIGVISSYLEFSDLFAKYGVSYERLVAGERKDLANPYRRMTPEEKQILESKLSKIHSAFVSAVARNRKMPEAKVWESATGEFFLGTEAKERGLIDELGNMDTAENIMKEKLNAKDIEIVQFEHERSIFDVLGMVSSNAAYEVGHGIGDALIQSNSKSSVQL